MTVNMDSTKILSLLEQLDDEVDDLEEALAPLLKNVLSDSASKLPLLDKAKLYVLVTYAIESILFSSLRLNGVKAREHPVFKELTRVKQYFDKIKAIEEPPADRTHVVDKGAAARFIKAGLAGNDRYDLERAEKQAKERARAHLKFEEASVQISKKRSLDKADGATAQESGSSDSKTSSSSSESEETSENSKKKRKVEIASIPGLSKQTIILDGTSKQSTANDSPHAEHSRKKKSTKKQKKKKSQVDATVDADMVEVQESSTGKKKKSKKSKRSSA